jgi:flagellar hook-associated protein 3 FlgL
VDGKYLFAGFEEKRPPFILNPAYDPALYHPDNDATWPVIYQGDTGVVEFEIAPNELITVNLAGDRLMQGNVDIFGLVTQLERALGANDPAAVAALIDQLEDAANQIRGERSLKGNVGRRLEIAGSQMEKIKIDMESFRSRFEDADIIETITQLQQQEQSFQAALSVTGRVSSMSILDYI